MLKCPTHNVAMANFRFALGVSDRFALHEGAVAELPDARSDDVEGVKRQLIEIVKYLKTTKQLGKMQRSQEDINAEAAVPENRRHRYKDLSVVH
jgi:hypothetical protein